MPNRIIKESICTSEKVSALKDFEFRLWIGLITQADDAGRGDARPAILKGRIFPLRDQVTAKNITDALNALATIGLVALYTVGGKPIFWLPGWSEHQRIRDCKPKFPGPEEADDENDKLPQSAASCGELPQSAALIQSESNPNPIQSESDARARDPSDAKKPSLRSICDQYAEGGPVRDALDGFVEMRKKDKKGFTVRALQLSLKKLDNLSAPYGDRAEEAKAAILDQSVQRGWAGLFDLKEPLPEKAPVIHHEKMPEPLTADEARTRSLEDLFG